MNCGVSAESSSAWRIFLIAVFELHEGVGRPKRLLEFLARDHFSRALEKQSQKAKGLLLQSDPVTFSPHFTSREIHLEFTETDNTAAG
jgi:hypothetical protein